MQSYKTIDLGEGRQIEIYQEESPTSPREDDNLGHMICWHGRYSLGDDHAFDNLNFVRNELDIKDVVLPLYLYDHSGITMSTTPFSCKWDSGQVGYIYAPHDKCVKEFGKDYDVEKITSYLKNEVKTYDQFLNGDIYGFTIDGKNGEIEDSRSGFYGSDFKLSGMFDDLSDEDLATVEAAL